MNLFDLDEVIASVEMPVSKGTLTEAWDMTPEAGRAGRVVAIVTMRARPDAVDELAAAARRFVEATAHLDGSLGSTLHMPDTDPRTIYLLERFRSEEAFGRHMGADYFARFQAEQRDLLAEPVRALFLERG